MKSYQNNDRPNDADARNQKAIELLPSFRLELGELAQDVPDSNLLKFLRWKPNIKRASERFRAHIKWRKENPWAFENLYATRDDELKRLLASNVIVIPPGLVDKQGGTVVVARLRNNDMRMNKPRDVCRMILYMIDRQLERIETQLHGVTVFHDLNGLQRHNLHPEVPRLIFRGIFGHFPLRIKGIYLLDAPVFMHAMSAILGPFLLTHKVKERMHFVEDIDDIYKIIDKEKLLEEHGGKRRFSSDEWVEQQCERESSGDLESLQSCWGCSPRTIRP